MASDQTPDALALEGHEDSDKHQRSSHNSDAPPPVLASEVLREDVAPLTPWDKEIRGWIFGLGSLLLISGVLHQFHLIYPTPDGARVSFSIGGVLILTAVVPLPYLFRGLLAFGSAAVLMSMGLAKYGPLSNCVLPAYGNAWAVMRMVAAIMLPAALLFRARYRAYRGARYVLATALVLAVPTMLHAVTVLVNGQPAAQVAAGLSLLAVAASFLGFMGSGTTAAATTWAVAVLVMLGVDVGARALWVSSGNSHPLHFVQTGLYFIVACTLGALGVFQALATALAHDARQVDVLGDNSGPSSSP